VGIEYSWGLAKLLFRNRINDLHAKNLHKNIVAALGPEVLSLARVRKMARRARDYKRAYKSLRDSAVVKGNASFKLIEKMCKLHKTHRCTLDQDAGFLQGMGRPVPVPMDVDTH
jgi:hypothetical protein